MTKQVEFTHELSRPLPCDHEIQLAVTAVLRHVAGEPGSASITSGWEIDSIAVAQVGGVWSTVTAFDDLTEAEQREVEEAAVKLA